MLRKTPAFAAITALALSAHAAVIIEFKQVGPDVVVTGSGSLNTAGLTYLATQSTPALLLVPEGIVLVGIPNELDTGYWSGASVTGSLGTGAASPSNGTGDRIGVYLDYVCLPDGYVSGTPLSASNTFSNKTLSDLGLNVGDTAVLSWGSGSTADSLTFTVTAVPEPHQYAMLAGLGLVGMGLWRRHARR